MKSKEQVVFDISEEKFKYLQRVEKKIKKVDIIDLNKRLNHTKRKNIYNNTKVITCSLLSLVAVALISLKF
jgi:hypothetical protein|tara:strand:- start:706 stop:918 length:213 start_codon:yes stop_codon:yes gene_type:complete